MEEKEEGEIDDSFEMVIEPSNDTLDVKENNHIDVFASEFESINERNDNPCVLDTCSESRDGFTRALSDIDKTCDKACLSDSQHDYKTMRNNDADTNGAPDLETPMDMSYTMKHGDRELEPIRHVKQTNNGLRVEIANTYGSCEAQYKTNMLYASIVLNMRGDRLRQDLLYFTKLQGFPHSCTVDNLYLHYDLDNDKTPYQYISPVTSEAECLPVTVVMAMAVKSTVTPGLNYMYLTQFYNADMHSEIGIPIKMPIYYPSCGNEPCPFSLDVRRCLSSDNQSHKGVTKRTFDLFDPFPYKMRVSFSNDNVNDTCSKNVPDTHVTTVDTKPSDSKDDKIIFIDLTLCGDDSCMSEPLTENEHRSISMMNDSDTPLLHIEAGNTNINITKDGCNLVKEISTEHFITIKPSEEPFKETQSGTTGHCIASSTLPEQQQDTSVVTEECTAVGELKTQNSVTEKKQEKTVAKAEPCPREAIQAGQDNAKETEERKTAAKCKSTELVSGKALVEQLRTTQAKSVMNRPAIQVEQLSPNKTSNQNINIKNRTTQSKLVMNRPVTQSKLVMNRPVMQVKQLSPNKTSNQNINIKNRNTQAKLVMNRPIMKVKQLSPNKTSNQNINIKNGNTQAKSVINRPVMQVKQLSPNKTSNQNKNTKNRNIQAKSVINRPLMQVKQLSPNKTSNQNINIKNRNIQAKSVMNRPLMQVKQLSPNKTSNQNINIKNRNTQAKSVMNRPVMQVKQLSPNKTSNPTINTKKDTFNPVKDICKSPELVWSKELVQKLRACVGLKSSGGVGRSAGSNKAKAYTLKTNLMPYREKGTQQMTKKEETSLRRKNTQFHPYKKEAPKQQQLQKRKWSFDVAYSDMEDLLHKLTVNTFLVGGRGPVDITKWQKAINKSSSSGGSRGRFRGHRFTRSKVPKTVPKSSASREPFVKGELHPAMFSNMEERNRQADVVEQSWENTSGENTVFMEEMCIYNGGQEQDVAMDTSNHLMNAKSTALTIPGGGKTSRFSGHCLDGMDSSANDMVQAAYLQREQIPTAISKTECVSYKTTNIALTPAGIIQNANTAYHEVCVSKTYNLVRENTNVSAKSVSDVSNCRNAISNNNWIEPTNKNGGTIKPTNKYGTTTKPPTKQAGKNKTSSTIGNNNQTVTSVCTAVDVTSHTSPQNNTTQSSDSMTYVMPRMQSPISYQQYGMYGLQGQDNDPSNATFHQSTQQYDSNNNTMSIIEYYQWYYDYYQWKYRESLQEQCPSASQTQSYCRSGQNVQLSNPYQVMSQTQSSNPYRQMSQSSYNQTFQVHSPSPCNTKAQFSPNQNTSQANNNVTNGVQSNVLPIRDINIEVL